MAKEEGIVMEGTVLEALPGATFKVQLVNNAPVLAHLSDKMKMNFIKVLPGDSVTVEMSPYDLTRGRIIRRDLKKGPASEESNFKTKAGKKGYK